MAQSLLRIGGKEIVVNHPAATSVSINGGKLTVNVSKSEPNFDISEEHVHSPNRSLEHQLKDALGQEGIKWGDAIAWATSKAGLVSCAPCKARQRILNEARRLGVKETIRQIAGTFRGSR